MPDRREALGFLATAAALTGGAPTEGWEAWIDRAGRTAVRTGATAGLAIGVASGGRTYGRGFGFANLETGTPAMAESIFRIASITKTFTATAILLLRDRDQLRLDQKLADFYPAIPESRSINLRQLLSHTSGLHDFARGGLPADAAGWRTADAFAAALPRMDPQQDFAPGTRYSYSNTGYVLLGGVIEKVSGLSYARFLSEEIFTPCGLSRTAVDEVEAVVRGRADGYSLAGGKPGAFRHPDPSGLPFAAGAVRSTVLDLVRWAQCFFAGRVVSPATVSEMTAPARVAGGARVGDARWWPPGVTPGAPPPWASDDHYGMGWELTTFFGRRTINHSGGIAGFNSVLVHYPETRLTLALLANTDNGIIPPMTALLERAGTVR